MEKLMIVMDFGFTPEIVESSIEGDGIIIFKVIGKNFGPSRLSRVIEYPTSIFGVAQISHLKEQIKDRCTVNMVDLDFAIRL